MIDTACSTLTCYVATVRIRDWANTNFTYLFRCRNFTSTGNHKISHNYQSSVYFKGLSGITQVIKVNLLKNYYSLIIPTSNFLNLCHWSPCKQSCALIFVYIISWILHYWFLLMIYWRTNLWCHYYQLFASWCLLHKTNRFNVAMVLFRNQSQETRW